MDTLEQLLEEFEKTKDISIFLASGVSLDPDTIRSHILSLHEEEQAEVESRLTDVAKALAEYITDLTHEKNEVQEQIDNNIKSVHACLSYGSAQGLGDKNKG